MVGSNSVWNSTQACIYVPALTSFNAELWSRMVSRNKHVLSLSCIWLESFITPVDMKLGKTSISYHLAEILECTHLLSCADQVIKIQYSHFHTSSGRGENPWNQNINALIIFVQFFVLFCFWRNEGEWLLIHWGKIMVKISERNTP